MKTRWANYPTSTWDVVTAVAIIIAFIGLMVYVFIGCAAHAADTPLTVDQLQVQLKVANEHIAQLEDRIKLMTLQQQGAIQFFTAGQQLCELDKKQSAPQIQH